LLLEHAAWQFVEGLGGGGHTRESHILTCNENWTR
jgi:hypothetical protein